MLYAIDAVGVGDIVVDIEHHDRVVGIDVDVVGVVRRCVKDIAVNSFDEPFSRWSFFLKIDFAFGGILGIEDERVVFLAIRPAAE